MSEVLTRRSLLKASCATIVGISGCLSSSVSPSDEKKSTSNSAEVPIIINNKDVESHDVGVEIWASNNDMNTTISVKSKEEKEITKMAGGFCIRAAIPDVKNAKSSRCPDPNEKDFSKEGYEISISSDEGMGKRKQKVAIEPY